MYAQEVPTKCWKLELQFPKRNFLLNFLLYPVYSKEIPKKPDNGERTLGSVSFVPSVAGLIAAGEVIKDIINKSSII